MIFAVVAIAGVVTLHHVGPMPADIPSAALEMCLAVLPLGLLAVTPPTREVPALPASGYQLCPRLPDLTRAAIGLPKSRAGPIALQVLRR